MTRLGSLTVICLLLTSSWATAGTIAVDDTGGRDNFLQQLNGGIDAYRAQSSDHFAQVNVAGRSSLQWYNPIQDRNGLYGSVNRTVEETQWAKSNLRVYDLYERLGGNAIDLRQVYQHQNGRFYVALDSVGGKWFDSSADAQGYMLKMLIQRSIELPASVRDAIAGLNGNDLETVVATARDALLQSRVFIARGTTTTMTLSGGDYSSAGSTPHLQGPDNIVIENAQRVANDRITATVRVPADTPLGAGKLLVFGSNSSMTALDAFEIFVTDGTGSVGAPADDHAATTGSATALTTGNVTAGRIGTDGDVDLFRITTSGGTVNASSSGGSDLVATLEDGVGNVIARSDDDGTWYNFSISETLGAGTYYLRISHCCAGTGDYAVTATFTP